MKRASDRDPVDYMAAAGCFCLASRQAARKITRLYDSYMQESGIRITQFTILSQLMLRGEMPIGKLAGILGMERTTLTRNLTPLEQQGWISINAGDDPRARIIGITAQGRSVVRSIPSRPASLPIGISPRSINCDRMVNCVTRTPEPCM